MTVCAGMRPTCATARQVELLLTLEEFCSEEGVFEGSQEGGRQFAAIFEKVCFSKFSPDHMVMFPRLLLCPLAPSLCTNVPKESTSVQVLDMLYDLDLVGEDAFEAWASEKANAEEDERIYLSRAQGFLRWLREASEEEESESNSGDE